MDNKTSQLLEAAGFSFSFCGNFLLTSLDGLHIADVRKIVDIISVSKIDESTWAHFDAAYKKSLESGHPSDWMVAALFAQQVRNSQT